jgi:hypothetical protein
MPIAHLVCVLPGLLHEAAAGAAPAGRPGEGARARCLARLFAAAGPPAFEPNGVGAALAPWYGVQRQTDWPFAALRVAALGVDPGADAWIAADPVTLEAGRDDVHLLGPVADLLPDEAAALVATLNAHFRDDGLAFLAPRPGQWFVRAAAAPELKTRPLDVACGRTLRDLLPSGRDAPRWRRWQSEIQMLLHAHPVNLAREAAARPLVNSVWFSGAGTRPAPTPRAVATWAGAGIGVALAVHVGRPAHAAPDVLDLSQADPDATTLVVVPDGTPGLDALERRVAAPAWDALARGAVDAVTLVADGAGAAVWTARRPRAWQRLAIRMRRPDLAAGLDAARRAADMP